MENVISFCGINCHECPAFLATKANDDTKRAEVAERWSKEFRAEIKPEHINCDGCHSEGGQLFGHCQICEIRKCAKEKSIENCAHCSDYSCGKLESFFYTMPDAKRCLDEIRETV